MHAQWEKFQNFKFWQILMRQNWEFLPTVHGPILIAIYLTKHNLSKTLNYVKTLVSRLQSVARGKVARLNIIMLRLVKQVQTRIFID